MAARFTQAAVTRAIKGAREGGLVVQVVEIDVDGTIRIIAADGAPKAQDRDRDEWRDDDV